MRTHTLLHFTTMVCLSLTLIACQNADAAKPGPNDDTPPPATTVEVMHAERGTLHAAISTTTILEAYQEADVTPRVSGIIERILVDEGDTVTAGQVIAELDKERLEQAVHQVAAELRGVDQELARLNEMASRQMVSADAVERLQANRDTLHARLRLAEIDLEASTIRAPISGVISRRYAKPGNLVQQHNRESLFHIVDLNQLQAVLHIPERDIGQVRIGQTVILDTNHQRFEAEVARISPAVDRVSGTFRVVVDVDNQAMQIRAGMFARAELRYATEHNALRVPADAIIQLDGEQFVYVVEDERAQRQAVRTGIRQGQWIQITDGISEHSAIITTGQAHISDNSPVVTVLRQPSSRNTSA